MFRRRHATCLASAMLVALLAGCGSSAGNGSAGAPTSSATSGNATTGASSTGLATARAAVARLEREPTTIPATTPLPHKPAAGKTIVYLTCEVPQCALIANGLKAATKAVGWHTIVIPIVSTDPSTLASAFQRALSDHPVAVAFGGVPYQLWSKYVPEFKRIGALIIPDYIGAAPLSETIPLVVGGPVDYSAFADDMVQWVVADSGGKAHVLVQNIGAYPAVGEWVSEVKSELAKICPACKVSEIEDSSTQIGGAGAAQSIVSEIRTDPSIDYFLGDNSLFFSGLNQALTNAGLKVKVGGMFTLPQDVQDITNGSGGASLAINSSYVSWLSVDAALRHSEGVAQLPPQQQLLPVKLVTKSSAQTSDGNFEGPTGFEQQFVKLWGVS